MGDNSGGGAALDTANGGYTVFGVVIGNGMDVVDALASVQTFQFASPFGELPLRNYTIEQFNDYANNPIGANNLEMYDIGFLPGDVNGDGSVFEDDLTIINENWQQTATGWATGDLNNDNVTDGLDMNIVGSNWMYGVPEPGEPPSSVPEPATLGLLIMGGLAMLRRRK